MTVEGTFPIGVYDSPPPSGTPFSSVSVGHGELVKVAARVSAYYGWLSRISRYLPIPP